MKALLLPVAAAVLAAGCRSDPGYRPALRCATAAAAIDGIVYVAGGVERSDAKDAVVAILEAYDPAAGTWSRRAPMPTPRAFAAAAAVEGRLIVLGGLDAAGAPVDAVESYDPAADAWRTLPGLETARSRLAAAPAAGGGVAVAGGIDAAGGNGAGVRVLEPGVPAWRERPDMPAPRHGHSLASAGEGDGRLFAVGGYDDGGPLARVDVLAAPGGGGTGPAWSPGPPLREARGFLGLVLLGRRLHAVGGRCASIPRTEVLDLDDVAAGWRPAAPLPMDLCRFSMVAWRGRLLVLGGETGFGASVNGQVFEYDPAADRWGVRGGSGEGP